MNFRKYVPACPACKLSPAAEGLKLVCPACGEVLEDFSPPRKREVMYRGIRWQEEGGKHLLWFRDVLIAHCGEKIYSEWAPESTEMVEVSREGYYHLIDTPVSRIMGLVVPGKDAPLRVSFPNARKAAQALRAYVAERTYRSYR